MIDYNAFDQILRVQLQNEWNQYFLLLSIGIVLIMVTHFGSNIQIHIEKIADKSS